MCIFQCWKHQVANNNAQGKERMRLLVKALVLRRTKDQVSLKEGACNIFSREILK